MILLGIFAFSCSESKREDTENIMSVLKSENYAAEKCFQSDLVVILAHELSDSSKTIDLQEYKSKEGDFIPVFTSKDKFKESTRGTDIGKPIIEINGYYLLSLLDGTEIVKVNPELSDESTFKAAELIEQFKSEISEVKQKLNK